jgi:hypothetical protein
MTIQSTRVEIACDESGFSGTNLLDPASPVIIHASIDLELSEAAELVSLLRSRFDPRSEYKSSHLLRKEQRPTIEWFLAALSGRAHVTVIDKTTHVAARVFELFANEPSFGAGTSLGADHSDAVAALRGEGEFLAAFVELTRTKRVRRIDPAAIERFFETMPVDVPALREVTRARVNEVMPRLIEEDPELPPPLEPLLPALAETVLFWSGGERSVDVVHDEQSAFTVGRVAHLGRFLADAVSPAPAPLHSFRQVDSRDDPRVQVADLLAGVARRGRPEVDEPLQEFLSTNAVQRRT